MGNLDEEVFATRRESLNKFLCVVSTHGTPDASTASELSKFFPKRYSTKYELFLVRDPRMLASLGQPETVPGILKNTEAEDLIFAIGDAGIEVCDGTVGSPTYGSALSTWVWPGRKKRRTQLQVKGR